MNKIKALRFTATFKIENPTTFKSKLLFWAQQYREVCYLDSNIVDNLDQKYKSYDCILAVDAFTSIKTDFQNAFDDLKQYQQSSKDWIFGHLSYDLKNDVEALQSDNFDGLKFDDLYFFQPKKIFFLKNNTLEIKYLNLCDDELESDYQEILHVKIESAENNFTNTIEARITKSNYIDKVSKILESIQRGDIYEANFCMEFYARNAFIEPFTIYQELNKVSCAPFSAYYKVAGKYLLCASPERYLKNENNLIISQPIKGTAKRMENEVADLQSKIDLQTNVKERSENVMITDLVRNDLSKSAVKGSVQVEELCKVYSYKQVHQMVSTVTSNKLIETSGIEIIKQSFPMGSMTGAPKISAMQIIENLEETKRGLYSGAIGYFTPNNDFDFNVVIRSILYNEAEKYVSFSVGSAITAASVPELEYEECQLKAKAMFEVLKSEFPVSESY